MRGKDYDRSHDLWPNGLKEHNDWRASLTDELFIRTFPF